MGTLPTPRCLLCGGGRDGALDICSECLRYGERPWVHAVSACAFRGSVREAVHRLKYQGGTAMVPVLGAAMAADWRRHGRGEPEVIVPVPLYWTRQWGRGYNQAELLACYVGSELGLPSERLLRRRRRTAQQAMLNMDARRTNVRGVFAPAPGAKIAGRRVLLVDDVMTTGATLGEAARALGDAAVAAVSVLTAARG
jgi:ComF family protein